MLDSFLGSPLLTGFGSGFAKMMEEGRSDTDALLRKAEAACRGDTRVTAVLGNDV